MGYDYIKDGQAIYDLSFERVRKAADLSCVPASLDALVVRLVHAVGMGDIVTDLAFGGALHEAAMAAFARKAPILCDCDMVANGITRRFLPDGQEVLSFIRHEAVPDMARAQQTTRSAAQLDLWRPHLAGAIVAIGNAPTALFRLLEVMQDTGSMPAVILGFPVGFVGAAESKEALIADHGAVPYITLRGNRGGSALAAAAVNALALDARKAGLS